MDETKGRLGFDHERRARRRDEKRDKKRHSTATSAHYIQARPAISLCSGARRLKQTLLLVKFWIIVPRINCSDSSIGGTSITLARMAAFQSGLPTERLSWADTTMNARTEQIQNFGQRYPAMASFIASGASVAPAAAATNPFDVVKVRRQLQVVQCSTSYGTVDLARHIVRNEGCGVLFKGASAAAIGGMFFGGCRIGLYQPLKESMSSLPISDGAQKVTAGLLAGTIAATVFNPLELVKTRLQSRGNQGGSSPVAIVRNVVAQQGVLGLWRGTGPSAACWAVLTASQCATYDAVKARILLATKWQDGVAAQLATSTVTGIVTTTASAPVDLVKSRIFAGGEATTAGFFSVALKVLRTEGPMAFFNGWTAQYLRLGPQTVITFMALERLHGVIGMKAL